MATFIQNTTLYQIGGYLLAIILIPIYVSMFSLWQKLGSIFSNTIMVNLPIIATITLLAIIVFWFRNNLRFGPCSKPPILAGIIICLAALLIPDPQFPVKRVHVAEYLLLSAVVRFAMSYSLQGIPLMVFSLFFTVVLGIHDEFLQGLHPARTYGLRDIVVNTMGSCGGALIWHGLNIFSRDIPVSANNNITSTKVSLIYLAWITISIICFIWPQVFYIGTKGLPLWPATMLIGTAVFFSLYKTWFIKNWKHGITAISTASITLVFYVILTNVTHITFY